MDLVVNVSLVSENDKLVLRNLLDLYLYDLSEFKGTDVNGHGYFEYRRLDQYWYDDSCHPFFITADGHIAGFVLVHRYGLLGENRNVVSEFFVMRKYRKLALESRRCEEYLKPSKAVGKSPNFRKTFHLIYFGDVSLVSLRTGNTVRLLSRADPCNTSRFEDKIVRLYSRYEVEVCVVKGGANSGVISARLLYDYTVVYTFGILRNWTGVCRSDSTCETDGDSISIFF